MEFDILIDYFAKEQKLERLQELKHISEQWSSLMGPKIKGCCPNLLFIACCASMCWNAATSCERENSK